MAAIFETQTCTRCGGCGHYSFNQFNGTTCFGCGGSGAMLTKRGRAAQDYYQSLRNIMPEAVTVGMHIKGWNGTYTVAEIVGIDTILKSSKATHILFKSAGGKVYAENLSAPVQIAGADLEGIREKALAYQATLTKAGTVRKNTKQMEE